MSQPDPPDQKTEDGAMSPADTPPEATLCPAHGPTPSPDPIGSPGSEQTPLATFYQLYPDAPSPTLADATLGGSIPLRALKHCEPFTSASGFGWFVYPPIDFSLRWEGEVIYWKQRLEEPWRVLDDPVLLPGLVERAVADGFRDIVEEGIPPFLGRAFEAGLVQIWSGLVVRTRPGWSILVRPLANFPKDSRYEVLDGLIETEWFFGPLVTPIRIRKTDEPIRFLTRKPLYQIQPVRTDAYRRKFLEEFEVRQGMGAMNEADWKRFRECLPDPEAPPVAHGLYKAGVRERLERERQEKERREKERRQGEARGKAATEV
ncbi:MAG: DUF6065 family protein [Holophagales bacterium]|nr:DUF6065 family protein [Holophagales bacterium]